MVEKNSINSPTEKHQWALVVMKEEYHIRLLLLLLQFTQKPSQPSPQEKAQDKNWSPQTKQQRPLFQKVVPRHQVEQHCVA